MQGSSDPTVDPKKNHQKFHQTKNCQLSQPNLPLVQPNLPLVQPNLPLVQLLGFNFNP